VVEGLLHVDGVLSGSLEVRNPKFHCHILCLVYLDEPLLILKIVFVAKEDYFDVRISHLSDFTNPVGNIFEAFTL